MHGLLEVVKVNQHGGGGASSLPNAQHIRQGSLGSRQVC